MVQYCSCAWIGGLAPALIVHGILGWSTYVWVVYVFLGGAIDPRTELAQFIVYAAVYTFFLVMMLWSYWKTILTPPAPIPPEFKINEEEYCELMEGGIPESIVQRRLPVISRTRSDKISVCRQCMIIKPDRAHHCSICKQCVLKMDHHCPWVNNCVGHHNYKYFCLFLMYAMLFLLSVLALDIPFIINWMKHNKKHNDVKSDTDDEIDFQVPLTGMVAGMFMFAVMPLTCMHASLLAGNKTTLESMRKSIYARAVKDKESGWKLPAARENFRTVFGDKTFLWLCPTFTWSTDGVHYDIVTEDDMTSDNANGIDEVVHITRHDTDEDSPNGDCSEALERTKSGGYGIEIDDVDSDSDYDDAMAAEDDGVNVKLLQTASPSRVKVKAQKKANM